MFVSIATSVTSTPTIDSNATPPLCPQCLLEIVASSYNTDGQFTIEADWPNGIPAFDCFMDETPKNSLISLTIVTDLVIDLVTEPVRFFKVFSVRFVRPDISSTFNTLFSSIRSKVSRESYTLILTPSEKEKRKFDVLACEVLVREIPRVRSGTDTERIRPVAMFDSEEALRDKIMNQEPLMSGSGMVCSDNYKSQKYFGQIS